MMKSKYQQGTVIIITLWTITLMTILITVIAGRVRLSSQAALRQQEELTVWANTVAAINQAEMELMMERMPAPPTVIDDLSEIGTNPAYRFDGEELTLHYPAAESMTVRIYDHAGKINIREISRPRMRELLEKRLGEDQDSYIDELIDAWGDWLDLSDGVSVNGAERDYYLSLDQPYIPRNGKLESVDEILSIRGFDEVFADVNMEAAFTLYTDNELVNLNLATREAMQLLPGLDDELIDELIAYRQENEFTGNGDVAQIVPAENMAELRRWLNSRKTSNFYTIMAYQKVSMNALNDNPDSEDVDNEILIDLSSHAYAEIVEIDSFTNKPKILRVNPYERIPERGMLQLDGLERLERIEGN